MAGMAHIRLTRTVTAQRPVRAWTGTVVIEGYGRVLPSQPGVSDGIELVTATAGQRGIYVTGTHDLGNGTVLESTAEVLAD